MNQTGTRSSCCWHRHAASKDETGLVTPKSCHGAIPTPSATAARDSREAAISVRWLTSLAEDCARQSLLPLAAQDRGAQSFQNRRVETGSLGGHHTLADG